MNNLRDKNYIMRSDEIIKILSYNIDIYDKVFPPIVNLPIIPCASATECYFVMQWLRTYLQKNPKKNMRSYQIKNICVKELKFIKEFIHDKVMHVIFA